MIDIPFKFSSDRLDPAFTVAYDWTDDVNTYVRWGQAYRAGGANSRSLTYRPFDEEEVSTWEIGAKTELFDRRVRFNLAAFHTTYKNRQVDFVNPASPSNLETLNAPESTTIKGVELDLTARLAPGLTLTGGYAFTDAEAAVDRNPFTDQLQEGAVLYTPKHSAVLGLDHEMSVRDDATLTTHVDAVYSSSFFTGGADQPKTGSYTMLNARVTLGDLEMRDGGAKIAFSLWGKNLTNARWKLFSFDIAGPGLANVSTAVWNEPRTYGVEAKVNF